MSRTYEMTAGAVIDAEGRTVINGVVSIYDAETGGNLISPGTLRQADGSAWPIEGVKTDGNGKVKALWPDSAGATPDRLYADTMRGRWPMVPVDLSSRVAQLEESGVGGGSVGPDSVDLSELAPAVRTTIAAKADASALAAKADLTALDSYVPTSQAATVVFDWDNTNTGDLIISAGGKTARFAFVNGVGAGGGTGGDTPPPSVAYEADIDFRWDHTGMPTGSPTTNLWPATKPSSGGPVIQWFGVGNHSGPAAGAFGSGAAGYTIGVDGARVNLGTLRSVEPAGTGGGFVAMSCKNLLWDSAPASDGDTSWVLSLFGRDFNDLNDLRRVQSSLYRSGGVWNWKIRVFNGSTDVDLATVPAQVPAVDFPDDNQHGVGGPMVLAWKLAGPNSKFIVASAEGTQTIAVNLTGIGDYKSLYLSEEPSGIERTTVTIRQVVAGADNFTDAKIAAALADLADDANFTIGA